MRQLAFEEYLKAQREARRFLAENPQEALLPVLEEMLPEHFTEIPLGLFEVPLSKIKGTYTAGRSPAFAGNFLPLLSPQSEFAQKWLILCQAHLSEGIRDPIKAYEYLGYYYVVEGHKRVSVLRHFGAYSLPVEVTRLLPPPNPEDMDNTIFYELIGDNRRALIHHLWFSKPGVYQKLMEKAAGFAHKAAPDEDWFAPCFFAFRQAYHTTEYAKWPLTTGDAFALYADVYGFPYDEPPSVTTGHLRTLAPLLRFQAGLPPADGKPAHPASSLTVCFAFEGMPGTSETCRIHNAARLALQRVKPDVTVQARFGLPPGDDAIPDFEALAAAKPHILFAPSPSHSRAALRAMLASKDTIVLHQHETPVFDLLPVYGGRRCPASFLAGVLAGALTETDVVGFGLPGYHEAYSFAHGARLVNPRAHTMVHRTALTSSGPDDNLIRRLTREGVDIAVIPCHSDVFPPAVPGASAGFPPAVPGASAGFPPAVPGQPKTFLGAYAWLCGLNMQLGCPSLFWGTLGFRWDLFYLHTIRSFLAGEAIWRQAGQQPVSLRMGMPLVDFFPIAIRLPAYTLRLLTLMRQCLDQDESLSDFPDGQKLSFITVT